MGTCKQRGISQDGSRAYGLNNVDLEPFPLKTWRCDSVAITVAGEESWGIDARPTLFCPATSVTGPLVDAGYGMPHEIDVWAVALRAQ